MSDRLLPNAGLYNNWSVGSSGWGTDTNKNWQLVDTLLMAAVISASTTAPPSSPTQGDRYLVPTGATGAWASSAGDIAVWIDGGWTYYTPQQGWKVYVQSTGLTLVYKSTGWTPDNPVLQAGTTTEAFTTLALAGSLTGTVSADVLTLTGGGALVVQVGTTAEAVTTLDVSTGLSASVTGGVLTLTGTGGSGGGGSGGTSSLAVEVGGTTAVSSGTLIAGTGVTITESGSLITLAAAGSGSIIFQTGTTADPIGTLEVGTGITASVAGAVLTLTGSGGSSGGGTTRPIIDLSAGIPGVSNWGTTLVGGTPTIANYGTIATAVTLTAGVTCALTIPAPSTTPYRVVAYASHPPIDGNGYSNTAVGFYDGTHFLKLTLQGNSGGSTQFVVQTGSGPGTVYSSTIGTPVNAQGSNASPLAFALRDDGTHVYLEASGDGVSWSTMYSETKSGGTLANYNTLFWMCGAGSMYYQTWTPVLRLWDPAGLTRAYS